MGDAIKRSNKTVSLAHGGSFMNESNIDNKTKDEVFDDFICQLFTDKLKLTSTFKNKQNLVPLEHSILISTVKKQNMQFLLNNLTSESKQNGSGILSVDDIRNAARMLGDISSSDQGSSLIRNQMNQFNFLNITNPDNMILPLKLDFNNFGDDVAQGNNAMDDEMEAMIAEGHVLKDFETSNVFSGVNHNFSIQRHLNPKRLAALEDLRKKAESLSQQD